MHLSRLMLLAMIICPFLVNAQATNNLQQADSLFVAGKYTESFSYYQTLLDDEHQYSPAMLLKMAYVKEALNQYSEALYYLNLYYLRTADKSVLEKMEKLAGTYNLRGYEFNDWEFFKTIFYRYYPYLVALLTALAILLLAMVYRERIIKNHSAIIPAMFMVIVLGLLFYTLNFGLQYNRAIVTQPSTYLMEGPSAGADVLTVIGAGHRLDIEGQQDVWIKTTWDDRPAYVKASKIKPVKF